MPENPVPVGKLVPLSPQQDVKPVGKLTVIGETTNPYLEDIKREQSQDKVNEIVNNIPDLNETKKKIWKDLALKGTPQVELSDALLTLQGKHPSQEGGNKYYYNDKGIPVPIKNDERPPKGYDVANDLHGTQEDANKKGFLSSAGSHLYNGVIKGVLGLEGLVNLPYALATGEDADWYTSAKNRVESSLYKSPEYETENQLFDTKDMKSIGDFLDPKRYNFSTNTVQGAALNGLESITSFLVGTKGLGAASKLAGAASEGAGLIAEGGKLAKFASGSTSAAQKTQAFGGSYAITLPEILDYAEANGITGQEKYALSAAIAVPVALQEMMFGTEGLFVKNAAAKTAKADVIKGIVDGIAKNADGSISKEALSEVFKATTKEAVKLNKSFARDLAENVAEEAGTEALQDFTKQGLAEIYDHISKEDNFKNDPLSLQAFGDYYNAALSGAAGAIGPGTAATIQKRNIEIQKNQSENIFNTVQKGDDAVNALKLNIDKSVQDGEITPEQGANAIMKVEAYNTYNKQINESSTPLNDEEKRRVFDLTFEKANLESQIPTEYEAEKLNGIQQASINVKKKQAKHLQDEIDKIILKSDVQNTTTPTAKKTEEEVAKDIEAEKELEAIRKTKIKAKEQVDVMEEEKPSTEKYTIPEVIVNEKRTYEEIPLEQWNDPKFNTRVKQYKLAEEIDKEPTKATFGVIQQDNEFVEGKNKVDTFNVTLPDGKTVRFASSMKRKPTKDEKGGYRGNTYEENFDNRTNPIGAQVGIKAVTLKDSGRKVLFIYNNEPGSKKGKHIGMVKESLRGNSNYSKADLEEMADLRMTNMASPEAGTEEVIIEPVKPISPADVKLVKPKVVLGVKSRDELKKTFIESKIKQLKDSGESNYDPANSKLYNDVFERAFDKLNPIQNEEPKEQTTSREEPVDGDVTETKSEDTGVSKEIKVRKGKTRIQQRIKDPNRIKAMKIEVFSPEGIVMQHFIGGGKVSKQAVIDFYKGSETEANLRSHMVAKQEKYGKAYAPDFDDLAHSLWAANEEKLPNSTTEDYKAAVESVVQEYTLIVQMAKDLIASHTGEKATEAEEMMSKMHEQAEKDGTSVYVDAVQNEVEKLSDEEIERIANDKKSFDEWQGENKDIITGDAEGDVFQKSKELEYAEGELMKAERELSASKKAFDSKRKELDKGLIEDQEDLFGERKTETEGSLFDERASVDARNEAVKPFKDRYDTAVKNYKKWQDKVNSLEGTEDSQTSLFQKAASKKANVEKIVNKLKSSIPGIKVVFDEKLKAAGKWSPTTKTITINPYSAGLDTPIHEYGHILIDAIGYNNKVIQAAIKQLKTSKLWDETKQRYPELNEEELGKEVLAEAIGREGAGIFDKESEKSNFKVFLDYIFDWLKTKLGMNKNIAKSLAKQVLSGRGVVAKEGKEQLQKTKETPEEKKQRKAENKIKRAQEQEEVNAILGGKEVKDLSFEKLIELYNHVIGYEKSIQDKYFGDVKIQIAYRLFTEKKNQLEKWQKEGKVKGYNVEESNKSDIKDKDVLMKNLSHMTQIVPELQAFSKMFEGAYFDMTQERYELKNELQKFGQAVIKEHDKKLGIIEKTKKFLFSSDNAKYFDFVENPKAEIGKDIDGDPVYGPGYWTLEEGKKKGFTEAQMDFLRFMHKLKDERNAQLEAMGRDMTNEVLKVDKGVAEAWRTEGLMQAFSSFLGNGFNLRNVRITYNGKTMPYGEVEKDLLSKGKKGTIEKLVALKDMFKYNMAAKRQIQKGIHVDEGDDNILQLKGGAKYGIDPHGALINKFMKNRSAERGYSKDFYKAAFDFIDESTHSKHMQELLPYIDSIEYLNKMGLIDEDGNILHGVKDNVAEWVKQWKDLHLFKVDKPGKLGPEADAAMKLLRTLTSQLVMAFNIKAGLINIVMGQYNNLRKETAKDLKEGHKRMIGNPKKAADILQKYQVISIDYESNPKLFAGKLFDYLAHGLTRAGEYYIQGSMFLGLMTEAEYNSFEYKKNKDGVDELVYTGKDEKKFKEEMIKHKNRVSDIQGKYADKDRRNFMAGEFGKMVGQFKVWVPDWWRERFGEEYITADGQVKKGSYRNFTLDAAKDLRDQIKAEGPKAIWNNKEAMTNLKGALSVAVLLSLKFAGDDDDKKRKQGDLLSQMTSNVLFIFDPSGLKFTLTNPVASLGTLGKFADVLKDAVEMDADKLGKDIVKVVPYNKIATQIPKMVTGE